MFAVKLLANSVVASNWYTAMNNLNKFLHFKFNIQLVILYYNWLLLKAVNVLNKLY